jgi:hypothetical protein
MNNKTTDQDKIKQTGLEGCTRAAWVNSPWFIVIYFLCEMTIGVDGKWRDLIPNTLLPGIRGLYYTRY